VKNGAVSGSKIRKREMSLCVFVYVCACSRGTSRIPINSCAHMDMHMAVVQVRILASVHHQMVIRYFDAFIEADKLYIVTELAKGGDIGAKIKRHLSRKELMNEEMIWGFFIQICQGLKSLHKANILHRDIKAQNIFLVSAREVKIGDLGVAKMTKGGMAHTQIGTPYYMSPEIWRNRPYNKKSDIWSLGCLLYELASLR
jgi:NIMA (never in mitosis gene a)-related kinase